MKNDFKGLNRRGEKVDLSVTPTLLMTAIADVSVDDIITTDFKEPNHSIFILGSNSTGSPSLNMHNYLNLIIMKIKFLTFLCPITGNCIKNFMNTVIFGNLPMMSVKGEKLSVLSRAVSVIF